MWQVISQTYLILHAFCREAGCFFHPMDPLSSLEPELALWLALTYAAVWQRFDPWPKNVHMPRAWPKEWNKTPSFFEKVKDQAEVASASSALNRARLPTSFPLPPSRLFHSETGSVPALRNLEFWNVKSLTFGPVTWFAGDVRIWVCDSCPKTFSFQVMSFWFS